MKGAAEQVGGSIDKNYENSVDFLNTFLKGPKANSADPDQTPHNMASDQGLHCLLPEFSVI